jgi:hypothetical protein
MHDAQDWWHALAHREVWPRNPPSFDMARPMRVAGCLDRGVVLSLGRGNENGGGGRGGPVRMCVVCPTQAPTDWANSQRSLTLRSRSYCYSSSDAAPLCGVACGTLLVVVIVEADRGANEWRLLSNQSEARTAVKLPCIDLHGSHLHA